jgi:hypothetical protein
MRMCPPPFALALLALAPAAPAAAQFKPKLPKINVAGDRQPAAEATAPAPAFNDRVLEVTNARVDQLLKGYRAEVAAIDSANQAYAAGQKRYESVREAYTARVAEYQKRNEEYEACQDREVKPVTEREGARMRETQDRITGGDEAAFDAKMKELETRMKAAQERGDMAEVMRLADSLGQAMGAPSAAAAATASANMEAAAAKCGAAPEAPKEPTPPPSGAPDVEAVGAKAAGLTTEQYAILRERVRYAISSDGKVDPEALRGGFTPGEIDVLQSRASELGHATKELEERGR